ncbi:hypothetical protein [Synechococcus sp. CBW1107]|uniref:hypothetical protein n=1 Tax=Synechococcus sp. CBW1107 TaxID=2789857 RepID=UPI002AD1F18F|nr:hypothetical protein [Synechococcus sp. CBW1107]CAK6697976.1 hypothetical protein MNNICLKF_02354 [Synechococcus sp. CBW1107]
MTDHTSQKLTPREMVRAHAYPVLAAVSTLALIGIATGLHGIASALVPIAKQAGYQNLCIEEAIKAFGDRRPEMKHLIGVTECQPSRAE